MFLPYAWLWITVGFTPISEPIGCGFTTNAASDVDGWYLGPDSVSCLQFHLPHELNISQQKAVIMLVGVLAPDNIVADLYQQQSAYKSR